MSRRKHKHIRQGDDAHMKSFKQELFELLTIQAPSGFEEKVVSYLFPVLYGLCDKVFLDEYGNLLAEKKVGDGNGATIVLSAHMDTVNDIRIGRKVLFSEASQRFTSSKGILGADDRAGIAIILSVLRGIDKTGFNGNIKVCFSREEEIGCVGADKIPVEFYSDANLAIVVDRRGSRDVVTGCGEMYGFCSPAVGEFFEDCSGLLDMNWQACPGGVSDAMTFSSNGVHSVNLSAGYNNEHTEKEYVDIRHCRDTINLILQAFSVINTQLHKFGECPKPKAVTYYYPSTSYPGLQTNWDNERELEHGQELYRDKGDVTFFHRYDTFGDVNGSTVAGYVSIVQEGVGANNSEQEVFMSEDNFRRMIDQYTLITGYAAGRQMNQDKELLRERSNYVNVIRHVL